MASSQSQSFDQASKRFKESKRLFEKKLRSAKKLLRESEERVRSATLSFSTTSRSSIAQFLTSDKEKMGKIINHKTRTLESEDGVFKQAEEQQSDGSEIYDYSKLKKLLNPFPDIDFDLSTNISREKYYQIWKERLIQKGIHQKRQRPQLKSINVYESTFGVQKNQFGLQFFRGCNKDDEKPRATIKTSLETQAKVFEVLDTRETCEGLNAVFLLNQFKTPKKPKRLISNLQNTDQEDQEGSGLQLIRTLKTEDILLDETTPDSSLHIFSSIERPSEAGDKTQQQSPENKSEMDLESVRKQLEFVEKEIGMQKWEF